MALTIANSNGSFYDPVEVSTGVYRVKAFLPGGSVQLTSFADTIIDTGLTISLDLGDQALVEPYTGDLDGYPIFPQGLSAQTDGPLRITMRLRRDSVASDGLITDGQTIAVLIDESPIVLPVPDPAGIPGPRGPKGADGIPGPATSEFRQWDEDSDGVSGEKTTSGGIQLVGQALGVRLGDITNPGALIVDSDDVIASPTISAYGGINAASSIKISDESGTPTFDTLGTNPVTNLYQVGPVMNIQNAYHSNIAEMDMTVENASGSARSVGLQWSTSASWQVRVPDVTGKTISAAGDLLTKGEYDQQESDERKKSEIEDMSPKLDDILALTPRTFIPDKSLDAAASAANKRLGGFIAQEVQEVFPSLVQPKFTNAPGEDFLAIGASSLVWPAMLVKAIQEQQELILELRAEVDALKEI